MSDVNAAQQPAALPRARDRHAFAATSPDCGVKAQGTKAWRVAARRGPTISMPPDPEPRKEAHMLRRAALALVLCASAGLAAPARADDWDTCKDESVIADAAITACSRLINSRRNKGPDLAIAYYNRAISYRLKNDNDKALADYNDSIRINPNYPRAFNNRGMSGRTRATSSAPSPTTARRSSSIPASCSPTSTAATCGTTRASRTAPSPTSTRRSSSIRSRRAPTTCAASCGRRRARSSARSPTSPKRSVPIRNSRWPTPTVATCGTTRATRTAPSRT